MRGSASDFAEGTRAPTLSLMSRHSQPRPSGGWLSLVLAVAAALGGASIAGNVAAGPARVAIGWASVLAAAVFLLQWRSERRSSLRLARIDHARRRDAVRLREEIAESHHRSRLAVERSYAAVARTEALAAEVSRLLAVIAATPAPAASVQLLPLVAAAQAAPVTPARVTPAPVTPAAVARVTPAAVAPATPGPSPAGSGQLRPKVTPASAAPVGPAQVTPAPLAPTQARPLAPAANGSGPQVGASLELPLVTAWPPPSPAGPITSKIYRPLASPAGPDEDANRRVDLRDLESRTRYARGA